MAEVTLARLVGMAARLTLAGALTTLGVAKLAAVWHGTHRATMFPAEWLAVFGIVECGAAILLCVSGRRPVLWGVLGLCTALLVATLSMILAGLQVSDCGCFGARTLSSHEHTAIALSLVALAIAALMASHAPRGIAADQHQVVNSYPN